MFLYLKHWMHKLKITGSVKYRPILPNQIKSNLKNTLKLFQKLLKKLHKTMSCFMQLPIYYKFSKSSSFEILITSIFPFIFLIIPFKTLPGPISYILSTPFSASLFIVSTHFTGPKV